MSEAAAIDLDGYRAQVFAAPDARALYRLCLDAPPVGRTRPPNLRWILWDAGHYPGLAAAYAAGLAGAPANLEHWRLSLIFAVAWLAGADVAQRNRFAAEVA